ncbi:tetratricopeptide repeat protein [Reichenbachiella sp.]|uniref:tetratricopeptide repeat protein n=1 Tax=Reichenbachiella sp. TaxID=2184521 RepID=UPI003BAF8A4E
MNQLLKLCCLSFILWACNSKSPNQTNTTLGELQHGFPISEKAQADFDQGLLLLHSFEYDDARKSFSKAIEADSNEVMAYWGKAMTHYKALWGLQNVESGREILNQVGSTKEERIAKADKGIERDFWEGLELLFGEGELKERNQAFADHLSDLHRENPKHQEIAAFYALSLLWSSPKDGSQDHSINAAAVAQSILTENPNHPGALHYTIHAFDSPNLAIQGIEAANKYASTAPDAVHALHMPSHIYLNRGMWNEVASSNENSYGASVRKMERLGLGDAARGFHSYQWLHYAYLQQGRFDKATQLMKDMLSFTRNAQTSSARAYLINMQNFQVTESGSWDLKEAPLVVDVEDLSIATNAQHHFFVSLMATKEGGYETIKTHIELLEDKIAKAELLVTTDGISMCSAGYTRYAPNKRTIIQAEVMLNQMMAMSAILKGDPSATENHLKKAVALESELPLPQGPPDIPLPSYEQYAYWLIDQARYEEALVLFDQGLERTPLRAKALQGKKIAYQALNQADKANEMQSLLDVFWQKELIASNFLPHIKSL